ncbi:hypothetical protein ACP70R_030116 [Stipagrostis hirtigluma subsp. patula]
MQNPRERKSDLSIALHRSDYNSDDMPKKCGISIAPEFAHVAGRVLQAPKLKAGDGWDLVVRNGSWNLNNNAHSGPILLDGVIEERPEMRQAPAANRVDSMFDQMKSSGPWKRKCLADFGIFTQCLDPPPTIKDQYLTNVLLKINANLGGLNSLLQMEASRAIPLVSRAPTIIFGMDVSNGSQRQSDVPSIAAEYLRDFMSEDTKQQKPEHIIIFRDGVNEGQFNQVLNIELTQIIEIKTCRPFLIVAQKNLHARFFLHNGPRDGDVANVSPGTVVDTGICHSRNYDFYMCAHAGMIGLQGQHITMYQRSTSAISVVAPVYYAHLAAAQVRQLVKFDDASETASSASGAPAPVPELPPLHESVRSSMFFC